MTSPHIPLSALLSEPGIAAMVAETAPWWLWTADAAQLVAVNASGARAMGATGTAVATSRDYSTTHAFAGQIARLAQQLPVDGAPRSERLRVYGRFGSESAIAEARRLTVGEAGFIAVTLPGMRRGERQEAAIALVEDLSAPALLFDASGAPLAASKTAHAVEGTGLSDLVGAEAERVLAALAAEGAARVDLVNGPMRLVSLRDAGLVLALITPEARITPDSGLRLVEQTTPEAPGGAASVAPEAPEAPGEPEGAAPEAAGEAEDTAPVPVPEAPSDVAGEEMAEQPVAAAEPEAPAVEAAETLSQAAATETESQAPSASEPDDGLEAPARFAWRLDADLRFHSIDPEPVAAPAGLTLVAAAERFGLDPQGALQGAVAASRPFSGVPAVWPLGTAGRRLAVTLAAFPNLRDGALQGYAGFGLVVEELERTPAPAEPIPAAALPAASDAPEAVAPPVEEASSAAEASSPNAPEPTLTTAEAEAESAPPEAEPAETEPVAASPDGEAEAETPAEEPRSDQPAPVSEAEPPAAPADLAPASSGEPAPVEPAAEARPVLTVHTNPPNVVALRTSVGQDPKRVGLSPGERNAFREIARALGAKVDPTKPEPPKAEGDASSVPVAEQTVPAPLPPPAEQSDVVVPSPAEIESPAATEPPTESVVPEVAAQAVETPAPADVEPPTEPMMPETAETPAPAHVEPSTEPVVSEAAEVAEPPEPAHIESSTEPVAPEVAEVTETPAPDAPAETAAETPIQAASTPIVSAPAVSDDGFVDSGTPFGPLPSAFGATPSANANFPVDARALLDRVPLGLIVHRGNAVLFANRALLDWTGFADTAALEAAGGVSRLFAGQENAVGSLAVTAEDGSMVPVDARLSKMIWNGEAAFLFTLRRIEEAEGETETATLSELRGRLDEVEQILDTATDGIVIVTADGAIESMNRSAEALFGYESAEVKGRSITALFAPESHRSALDYCDGLLSNGVASVLNDGRQIIGRVKQGGLIPLYMTMGRTGPTAKPKLAAVFRDMTQWKKAEEELLAAKRQAERASSQKSDFLAKVSHEIRTPLNAIIGFSEVMMEERFGPVGNERYRDYLKDIHASGGHVLSLINDLLDLSKIEAGKLELSFTSVDLNDTVQSSVAIMQPQANRERVIIRSSLARLPNVVADARSLRQIVLNLLSNSVKFTPAGGQIIISTALSDAGEAVLRVRDTGVGMTDAELQAAMEPFRQVATTNPRASKGTGLGLPLTKALVEANRASFGISSTPNQGTLVEVVFPPTRVLAE
jgi:PAS domain S-box-containing protein